MPREVVLWQSKKESKKNKKRGHGWTRKKGCNLEDILFAT